MRYTLWVLLAGCAPTTYAFTPSSNRTFDAKPGNCTVEALTTPPTRSYEELGTLDHYSGDVPKNLDAFRTAVAKQVCQLGGDAAIGIANGSGSFAKGSVIRYVGDMAEPVKKVDTPMQQAKDTENPNK
jgi:hypothetical protein